MIFFHEFIIDLFFFFFSSRRRHTRCSRDWSSDVCSSDLNPEVRRARLRLLTANAVRHLSQNKVHLVELDAAALEALPQAGEVNRPAFQIGRASCRERV